MCKISDKDAGHYLKDSLRGEACEAFVQLWRETPHANYKHLLVQLKQIYEPESDQALKQTKTEAKLWKTKMKKKESLKAYSKRLLRVMEHNTNNETLKKIFLQQLLQHTPEALFFKMQEKVNDDKVSPQTFISEAMLMVEGAPKERKMKKKLIGDSDTDTDTSDSDSSSSSSSSESSSSSDSDSKKKHKKKHKKNKKKRTTEKEVKQVKFEEPPKPEENKKLSELENKMDKLAENMGSLSIHLMQQNNPNQGQGHQQHNGNRRQYHNSNQQYTTDESEGEGERSQGYNSFPRGRGRGRPNFRGNRGRGRGGFYRQNNEEYQQQFPNNYRGNYRFRGNSFRGRGGYSPYYSQQQQMQQQPQQIQWTNLPQPNLFNQRQPVGNVHAIMPPPQLQFASPAMPLPQLQFASPAMPPPQLNIIKPETPTCVFCQSIFHTVQTCPELKNG